MMMSRLDIKSMTITDTGTYNNQYRRPYVAEVTDSIFSNLYERVAEQKCSIDSSTFLGLGGQIVKPSTQVQSDVAIPNGWNERRNKFVLHVETRSSNGIVLFEIIQGYTEYVGASRQTGNVDDDMKFFINTITHVTPYNTQTPHGVVTKYRVVDASHLLFTHNYNETQSIYYNMQNAEERMRPEDVLTMMQRSSFMPELEQQGAYDETTKNTVIPVKASVGLSLPNTYASDILGSYQRSSGYYDMGAGYGDVINHAIRDASSQEVGLDPFLMRIREIKHQFTSYFTLRDLEKIQPGVGALIQYRPFTQQDVATAHQAGQSGGWNDQSFGGRAAALLANAIPSMMLQCGVGFFDATFTNMNRVIGELRRDWTVSMAPPRPLVPDQVIIQNVETLKARIISELLTDLSENNLIDLILRVSVNFIGDTIIEISIGNSIPDRYVQPTYANALTTSLISNDQKHAATLADDFNVMTTTLFPKYEEDPVVESSVINVGYGQPAQQPKPIFNQPVAPTFNSFGSNTFNGGSGGI